MTTCASVLTKLQEAADPVTTMRQLVLAHGGHWYDPEHTKGLFEIQLMGLVGIGPSVGAAVDDWLIQAKDVAVEGAGAP